MTDKLDMKRDLVPAQTGLTHAAATEGSDGFFKRAMNALTTVENGVMSISNLWSDPGAEKRVQDCMIKRGIALEVAPDGQRPFCDGSVQMYTSGDYPVAMPMEAPKR